MRSRHHLFLIGFLVSAALFLHFTHLRSSAGEVKILRQWSGTYKVSDLKLLPEEQRDRRAGCITDARTFEKVWGAFRPRGEAPKEVPKVDFTKEVVFFLRNTQFLNGYTQIKVHVDEGKAHVQATSERTALPIKDHVNMVIIVVPREKDLREIDPGDRNKPARIPPS